MTQATSALGAPPTLQSPTLLNIADMFFGFSGAHIITAYGIAGILGETLGHSQKLLSEAFDRCKYYTHARQALIQLYTNDEYLHEDGTTDGGCALTNQITEEDPQQLCPTGVGLRERDGCNDQLSCGACVVSDSSDLIIGFQCFWCEETRSCHSRGTTMFFEGCPSSWLGPPATSAVPDDGSTLEFRQNQSFGVDSTELLFHAFDVELAEMMGVARDEVIVSYRFTFHAEYAGPAGTRQPAEEAIATTLASADAAVAVSGEGGRVTVEIITTSLEEARRLDFENLAAAASEGQGWDVVGVPQVQMEVLGGVAPPRQCNADMDDAFNANNAQGAVVSGATGFQQR